MFFIIIIYRHIAPMELIQLTIDNTTQHSLLTTRLSTLETRNSPPIPHTSHVLTISLSHVLTLSRSHVLTLLRSYVLKQVTHPHRNLKPTSRRSMRFKIVNRISCRALVFFIKRHKRHTWIGNKTKSYIASDVPNIWHYVNSNIQTI